jgi:tubulin-specific chaperone A
LDNQTLTSLQRQALQETKNVLPGMKIKIEQAVEKLEDELVS